VAAYLGEHFDRRSGERDCPVGRIECRKQRKPGRYEIGTMRKKEPATSSNDGAKPSEGGVVPVGHFENGESPEAPASMAFSCALGEVLVEQCVRAKTHDDEHVGY
jgi:hypothetical protein